MRSVGLRSGSAWNRLLGELIHNMFIDTHTHSKGASYCSQISVRDLIDFKISLGYDGMILTNHIQRWYYKDRPFESAAENLLEEFADGKKYADERGFRLFLGVEVSIDSPRYSDILIHGNVAKLFRDRPETCALTQKELFEYCNDECMLMIQAHPIRQGMDFLDPAFLHGVEINCQPNDLAKRKEVEKFAADNDLLLFCGTDTHNVDMTTRGGLIVPDDLYDSQDFVRYVRETKRLHISIDGESFFFPA